MPRLRAARHLRPRSSILALVLALVGSSCLTAGAAGGVRPEAPGNPTPVQEIPSLLVLVVVDQLRPDLLERYEPLFTGGLKRLLDEGRRYRAVTMDHLVTETAPGHATLSTGVHPSSHGVVGNYWWRADGRAWIGVENVVDETTTVAGEPRLAGASPAVLERSGIADWLLAAHPSAQVVSLSGKVRGAVLLAGQGSGEPGRHVYWFEPAMGGFVTSTAYADEPAPWVAAFNASTMVEFADDTLWTSTVPPDEAYRSRPDTAAYELDGVRTHFPHSLGRARSVLGADTDVWSWWGSTPGPDAATLMLASTAVEARDLGGDDVPDLLAVSLSQTDRVGHGYGPLSREQFDNLLRLDAALGRFFDDLDARVGAGAWSVVLTADHGAMDMPEWSGDGEAPGLRLGQRHLDEMQTLLRKVSADVRATDPAKLAGPLADALPELPWVARAWSHETLARGEAADSFSTLAVNGYFDGRATGLLGRFGVEYQVAEGVLPFGFEEAGSTHQSGYLHDRSIPLILMGAGVQAGSVDAPVSAIAVAPTLAAILGIPAPDDLPAAPLVSSSSSPAPSGSASRRP